VPLIWWQRQHAEQLVAWNEGSSRRETSTFQ
jgi:hypothetical protein